MHAKKRYFVLCCAILSLIFIYSLIHSALPTPYQALFYDNDRYGVYISHRGENGVIMQRSDLGLVNYPPRPFIQKRSFLEHDEFIHDRDLHPSPRQRRSASRKQSVIINQLSHQPEQQLSHQPEQQLQPILPPYPKHCRMDNCFDFSKCDAENFKIFIYPKNAMDTSSALYEKILRAIRESSYYTTNQHDACVSVLAIDTLERDILGQDYVKNVQTKLDLLPTWNKGRNHVLFLLYSGTWPDYLDQPDFPIGEAILAKASFNRDYYRPEFDVSLPLFPSDHPFRGGSVGGLNTNHFPLMKPYMLVFKGKRYLTGIGSDTRNALYHINNRDDIVLLTTCRHGNNWKRLKDERCDDDNNEFDRYDYQNLLHNSTFCLVPRGRRLGSFRFLEAVRAGCIPVVLSNGWVLPFSEIIDWNRATVMADERLLLQVPSIVRSVSDDTILSLRQQTQFLWNAYFSSVDKIVRTTFEIIHERVCNRVNGRSMFLWNHHPGGLLSSPQFSQNLADFPFYTHYLRPAPVRTIAPQQPLLSDDEDSVSPTPWMMSSNEDKFTAVIYVSSKIISQSAPLFRLIRNVAKSQYAKQILVIWGSPNRAIPENDKWPVIDKPMRIIKTQSVTINSRFHTYDDITTSAVLSLDDDVSMTTDEVDFGFSVWKHFPERIVGSSDRSHYYDPATSRWLYSSKFSNEYSMVLTGAAFLHRYYMYLYERHMPPTLRHHVGQVGNCEDILMNLLVAHITRLPPIRIGQHRYHKDSMIPPTDGATHSSTRWTTLEHFNQRRYCMHLFVDGFGYMPLVRSQARFDPSLFKDDVSVLRKMYRQMESV